MSRTARSLRRIFHRYATLLASVVLFFAHAYGIAQNLKSVPVIYNYPLFVNGSPGILENPSGMAVDAHGDLFIVDNTHSKIWKVDPFQTITLFAGTGHTTLAGDGGLAVEANLNQPFAVAVDVDGNVFIADTFNYAVRRVDAITGIITTVAGGHGGGYTGDNGPATSAKIGEPVGLAVDNADDIYISDGDNKVVRRVSSTGIITTFAGGGTPASGNGDGGLAIAAKLTGPSGIALDASGNLYIADFGAAVVRKVDTTNTITTFAGSTPGTVGTVPSGPATSAKLVGPVSVATDSSGNVYIADSSNGMASVVDTTNTITVLTGQGPYGGVSDGHPAVFSTGFGAFSGLAVDYLGNVYFDSYSAGQVYKIVTHPERFLFTKVGQTSPPQRIVIENKGPSTITISSVVPSGDFHIAPVGSLSNLPCTSPSNDSLLGNGTALSWCTMDIVFTPTAAGIRTGPLTITSNDTPTTTAVPLTSLGMSPTVAVSGGVVYTVAGEFPDNSITNRNDNVLATTANLVEIDGITFDSTGNVFFSEYGTSDVRRVDAKTGIISTVVGDVSGTTAGPATGDGGPATKATLDGVGEILIGPDSTMYVVDGLNHEIRTVDTSGIIHRFAGNGASGCPTSGDGMMALNVPICTPTGIAFDAAGNLYYSNGLANSIHKITPGGVLSTIAGVYGSANGYSGDGGPALSAHLKNPWNLVVDSKGNIFFDDEGNEVVRRIDANTKVITTVAGIGTQIGYSGDGGLAVNANLSSPFGLGIDAADNLYIADSGNNVIRKVDSSTGIITTVAGNNIVGNLYNGNGIPATAAGINHPESVAVDAAGDIFYGDDNGLLRVVSPNGLIDFGNQLLNTTSAFQSVSISNIGNLPLHFDATTPYAIDGDFTFTSGGTCDFTQPLAVGSSCTVHVLFTPSVLYERYGTLNFNDDGTGSPQITQLRGNGVVPAISLVMLAPNPLTFPNQTVSTTSATQTLTLSNPGTSTLNITGISLVGANPGNFAIVSTATCGSAVPAGGSCSIVLSFTPNSVATFTATVMVTDSDSSSPQSATVTGNGTAVPAPQVVLTPAGGLTFSSTIGTSTTQTFTLTNTGNATLNITGFTVAGASPGSFTATSTGTSACGTTLAAAAHCTISVSFTPASTTTVTANVTVTDNAANSPQVGLLSGSGTPAITAPDFTIAATPPGVSVFGGAAAQYTINLASVSTTLPFTAPVTLAASGLPPGATATFAPPTGTPRTTGASSTMTIQTVKTSASLQGKPLDSHSTTGIVSLAFLFFSFVGLRKHRRVPRLFVIAFALILSGIGAAGLTGCGGGYALPGATAAAPKTYTITVTGTNEATQHSTTVTLTVN